MEKFHEQGLFDGGAFGMSCDDDEHKLLVEALKHQLRIRNPNYDCYEWYHYLRSLLAHKIYKAKSNIDDADPLIPTSLPMSYNGFNRRLTTFLKIEKENAILLKKIQQIFARQSQPHTKLKKSTTHYIHSQGIKREREIFQQMFQNIRKYERLKEIKPVITRKEQLEAYEAHRKILRRISNYPVWNESRVCAPHEVVARKRASRFPRDRVYFDIEVEDIVAARIVIELYSDVTPMACENFRCLCMGVRKESFQCVRFDKVVPGILWKAATGKVNSIYGYPFPAENFKVKHDKEGLISMPTFGKRGIRSEFIITLRPLQCLDGQNLVVGKIIHGMSFIRKATNRCQPMRGNPLTAIMLMKCGEVSDMAQAIMARPLLFREVLDHTLRAKLVTDHEDTGLGNTGEDDAAKEEVHDFTPTSSYSGGGI